MPREPSSAPMTATLDRPAILGGRPAFREPLHVGRPNLGDEGDLVARLKGIFARRWLTNDGPLVEEFEERVAAFLGVRHCVAVANCTGGLELAARALGLAGEVILPSFTFIATAHAFQWMGLTPVFCDVDPATHNIDPGHAESLITERTSAIVGVHLWGRACDTTALEAVARRHGLALLFDAAHAFGCSHQGRMIGSFGNLEVLSFHATKVINTFEGGAVVTDDDGIAERVRLMRSFGFADVDIVVGPGTNAKMTEIAAAMGLTSLDAFDGIVEANRRNHRHYARRLAGVPGLSVARYDPAERSNFHYAVVEVDEAASGLGRDALLAGLEAENVLARRYFHPGCHLSEPYRSRPGGPPGLPAVERLAGRLLQLPTGTAVGEVEVAKVCRIVRLLMRCAPEVGARYRESAGGQ